MDIGNKEAEWKEDHLFFCVALHFPWREQSLED